MGTRRRNERSVIECIYKALTDILDQRNRALNKALAGEGGTPRRLERLARKPL